MHTYLCYLELSHTECNAKTAGGQEAAIFEFTHVLVPQSTQNQQFTVDSRTRHHTLEYVQQLLQRQSLSSPRIGHCPVNIHHALCKW